MRRLAPLALLCLALSACAAQRAAGGPLPEVVEDAAKKEGPLVVQFWAAWCKYCAQFDREVLAHAAVKESMQGVQWVRYDVDKPVGQDALRRCRLDGSVPTTVVIDRSGRVRMKLDGASSPEEFLEFLRLAKQLQPPPAG